MSEQEADILVADKGDKQAEPIVDLGSSSHQSSSLLEDPSLDLGDIQIVDEPKTIEENPEAVESSNDYVEDEAEEEDEPQVQQVVSDEVKAKYQKAVDDLAEDRYRNAVGTVQYFNNAVESSKLRVSSAKSALVEALNRQDNQAIADAHASLSEAHTDYKASQIQFENAKNQYKDAIENPDKYKQTVKDGYKLPEQARPEVKETSNDAARRNEWSRKNSWFTGNDADPMNAVAISLHKQIVKSGDVRVGSQQYYQAIDEGMKKSFPNKFRTINNKTVQSKKPVVPPSTVVSSQSQQSVASNKLTLTTEEYNRATKLNITNKKGLAIYAREVAAAKRAVKV